MLLYEKVKYLKTINSSKVVHRSERIPVRITMEFSFGT